MKDDKILKALAEDRMNQCEDMYMITRTDFLDLHQKSLIDNMIKKGEISVRTCFVGGYDDAERTFCAFLPDYASVQDLNDEMTVVRISCCDRNSKLTHRDYLGALLGMGIRREKTGDILVRDDGADIIVLKELAEFIELNLSHVGRIGVTITLKKVDELLIPERSFEEKSDTVASLRLDNIISSAFGISRTKAAEAIRKGIVYVNSLECQKPDRDVQEGDKLVLRGKGKAYLIEIGGITRKGRIYVKYRVY